MPARVQTSFREPTDRGFWEKSRQIFQGLCAHGRQRGRGLAQQTGLSTRSVHCLRQAMERRDVHPESWLWATAEGRQGLTRLVVATLYPCGLKRGVGVATMSAFLMRLPRDTQGGCAPCAVRQVLQTLAKTAGTTAETGEQDARATGEGRESIGGVDATVLARRMVGFQDWPTGSLMLEDMADDRPFPTWQAGVHTDIARESAGRTHEEALRNVISRVDSDARQRTRGGEERGVSLACDGWPRRYPQVHVPACADSSLPGVTVSLKAGQSTYKPPAGDGKQRRPRDKQDSCSAPASLRLSAAPHHLVLISYTRCGRNATPYKNTKK